MSVHPYVRTCSVALMLAGALFLAGSIAQGVSGGDDEPLSQQAQDSGWVPIQSLYLVGSALLVLALPGLHLAQAHRTGPVGLVALVVATLGIAGAVGMMWTLAFVPPSLAAEAPAFLDAENPPGPLGVAFMVSWIGLTLSFVIVGGLNAWTAAVSRWAGILVVVGALGGFVLESLFFVAEAVLAVGLGWLGWALWHSRGSGARAAADPASPQTPATR